MTTDIGVLDNQFSFVFETLISIVQRMAQPEVTIQQGTLRGSTATDFRGNPFLKFQGIPYAKPPLGNLRFKVKFTIKSTSSKNLQKLGTRSSRKMDRCFRCHQRRQHLLPPRRYQKGRP